MRSNIVIMIQECYCGWVSFLITPNLVQEISSVVSKLQYSAFISSLNSLYQRDHNVIPAAETLPSKCVKTCQILQKHPETARILLQTPWHLLKALILLVSDGIPSPMKDIISVK